MSFLRHLIPAVLVLSVTLMLAGCESAEERAEGHYKNALSLVEEGDIDRAIVELRNVFKLNSNHKEARRIMAELQLEKGNRSGAYRQYLRLAEQDPDDLDTRIILSRMAFLGGNWEEVNRHGNRIEELAPETPSVQAITLVRTYRDATRDKDLVLLRELGLKANAMLAAQPDNPVLRNIMIDFAMREQDFDRALAEIDWMIAYDPTNNTTYQERLRVLGAMGDEAGFASQLRQMVDIFPDDPTHKATLVRYYISRNKLDLAEEFLRDMTATAGAEETGPTLDVIQFLVQFRGTDFARAELETIIATHPDPLPFQTLAASLDFSQGKHATAIATLEGLLEGAEPSDQTRGVKVTLARMLQTTDNEASARSQIEEVLTKDPNQPGALKVKAGWQIAAGDTDAAISGLRLVLDQRPEDATALSLMADAYEEIGEFELARDFMARAVQASRNAPAETLRLARQLVIEESYLPAEDVLIASLRVDRTNIEILNVLGQLYLRMEDFGRAQGIANALRRIDSETAVQTANKIEAERLRRQRGVDEALAFLQSLATAEDASMATRINFIRAQIDIGDPASALFQAYELEQDFPGTEAGSLVLAVAHAANHDLQAAISLYRTFLDGSPARPDIWLELARLHQRKEDRETAKSLIDEGLTHTPNAANLLAARASFLEQDGEIDAAIAIYEQLHAQNAKSLGIINNLASLLATHRNDAESLQRAWTIARRLRNAQAPAQQDTYGWILHRRGESAEALPYLETAVAGLPNEPLVAYHLGQAYIALNRPKDALTTLRKAVRLANPADTRPQIEEARALVHSLQNAATPGE